MIGWEKRVLLRHYLEQGLTKAAVAEQLGVSRRTVHYWIETGQLDRDISEETTRYGPRPPVPTKLDAYKGIVLSRLAEYPELTAVRLFEEIKAAGYSGGYTQVKEYVRRVRPRPPEEPLVRFETAPGHQGQVDFADFRLPWGKRYALLVVLGYSRQLWLRYFTRKTMAHVFEGLEAAFASFGGVPSELLFDQMKAVIIDDERDAGGRVTENAEFLRFAYPQSEGLVWARGLACFHTLAPALQGVAPVPNDPWREGDRASPGSSQPSASRSSSLARR